MFKYDAHNHAVAVGAGGISDDVLCIYVCIYVCMYVCTVLSRASGHGCLQLKRQNLRVGGYMKKVLKWFNYPRARDAKLAAMGPNRLASSVCPCFVDTSLTVEKAVSCYKTDRLVASLLSFRSVQSSLAVCEFRAAGEERCEWGYGWVCAKL